MHDPNENRSSYHKTKVGWLPNDWDCAAFGQIARRVSKPVAVAKGEYYREIGLRSHGRGVFHKEPVQGADLGEKRVFRVQPGALVFNIVFAWEQAVAMTSEAEAGMIASHRFPMFVGRDGKAEATFLLRYFLTPRGKHELGLASPGGAGRNKTLGQEDLNRLPVPLPPLAEQRRIVEVLVTWDAALRDVEALIAAQRRRKTGLMQQLLGGHTRLPGFTGEWLSLPFHQCFRNVRATMKIARTEYSTQGRLPIVDQGIGLIAGYTDSASAVPESPVIVFGDHTRVVKWIDFPFVPGADGTKLLSTRDGVLAEFGYQCLAGSTVPCLGYARHFGLLRELTFALPPLPEQRAIAAVLGAADEELRALEQKRAALERQKRGLMQQLLSGALRVSPGQGDA